MRISDWSSDVCSSDLTWKTRPDGLRDPPTHQDPLARPTRASRPRLARAESPRAGATAAGGGIPRLRGRGLGARARARADRPADAQRRLGRVRQRARMAQLRLRRSEEHPSELQSLMRIPYAVFCLKKKKNNPQSRTQ